MDVKYDYLDGVDRFKVIINGLHTDYMQLLGFYYLWAYNTLS